MDDEDRRWFLGKLARVSEREGWRVHAYCLMNTHIHVVVETPNANLGVGMQRLLGGHAFDFNRRHGRLGHLFAGPYWASIIAHRRVCDRGLCVHRLESCSSGDGRLAW